MGVEWKKGNGRMCGEEKYKRSNRKGNDGRQEKKTEGTCRSRSPLTVRWLRWGKQGEGTEQKKVVPGC